MKDFGKRFIPIVLAGMGGLSLAACSNTATIHYDEVATCYLFDSDPTGSPHTTTASGNGLFVIYKVTSIENKASGAKDFNFTPHKVYSSGQNLANSQSFDYLLQLAQPKTVAKGTTATNLGKLIVDAVADPKTDQKADFPLYYNSSDGESVLLVRDNRDAKPKFLDPCSPASINGL